MPFRNMTSCTTVGLPMRDDEGLRACPTCGSKGVQLGARDYSRWAYDLLPGRCGFTDIDAITTQNKAGRGLALEFKADHYIPRGQMLTFDFLTSPYPCDVWLVRDKDFDEGQVELCVYRPGEQKQNWKPVSVEEFRHAISVWWEMGEEAA